jgi:serine/threonine protein kinase
MSDIPFANDDNTPARSQFGRDTIGDAQHEPPPRNEGEMLGEFVLEKLLGRGGSGFVYRALDTKAGQEVGCCKPKRCALKVLRLGDPETVVRNRLGFRAMMQVHHPNLIRVDRIHRLGDYTALAMEEVHGETLTDALIRLRHVPVEEAFATLLAWMRDFGAGLAAMHGAGFIHRDIKPLNLMIDSDGRGRVIDYGLVEKFDIDGVTTQETNFILGTPRYWAPEVLYRQRYLPAGDIFALGLVILESVQYLAARAANVDAARGGESEPLLCKSDGFDADSIYGVIDELCDQVPALIVETCREMLDRHASERPTATQIARLGLPPRPIEFSTGHEPLIGRDDVLQEIRQWVDGVFAGRTERLHLSGPLGIGKTRILDVIIDYIQSKHWGQVFRGRCRLREDAPWQAFEQICDSIANRYSRPDREPIELDPVSAEILWGVYPFLRKTVVSRMELPPAGSLTMRLDSLEAAVRFSKQLRKVGPLFIVIDDIQWADQDTLNVMDRLQTATDEIGMGIITVSRGENDRQQIPPHRKIQLGPIDDEPVKSYLTLAAEINHVQIDDATLNELTGVVDGSPFRLQELTYEFRPGGALSQVHLDTMVSGDDDRSMNERVSIKQLWQCRFDRLSEEAKQALLFVVTAGGQVSTQQLGELTGQGDDIDVAVSELSRLRLILDEATGGECISIFHDRFADQVTMTLTERDKRRAHAAWASLLQREDDPSRLAARISSHWIAAGQPGRAVSHAILAAEDAERIFAHSEAARWHARVVDHLSGEERLHHIRQAARCYRDADLPVDAARYYLLLAELCDGDQRFECELSAAVLMLRCGQYEIVRDRLAHFATELGLPRPKSPMWARLNLMFQLARARRGRNELMRSLLSLDDANADDANADGVNANGVQADAAAGSAIDVDRVLNQRFDLCLAVIRPMSMYDNLYAGELSMAASKLARRTGTPSQRINIAVGEAVFGAYDRGPNRIESEANLQQLIDVADRHGDSRARGDVWAGIAFSHVQAGRWSAVNEALESCVDHYEQSIGSHRFEVAHVQWIGLWADWWTGNWQRMAARGEAIFDEAIRRNDLFQQQSSTGGLGGNAWLIRDRLDALTNLRRKTSASVIMKSGEVMHFLHSIGLTLDAVYAGDFPTAWQRVLACDRDVARLPLKMVQQFRVLVRSTGALIAVHSFAQSDPSSAAVDGNAGFWAAEIGKRTLALRGEKLPFTDTLADLYDGLLNHHRFLASGNPTHGELAIEPLRRVQADAAAMQLWPLKWAAEDAIAVPTGQINPQTLAARMRSAGVIRPDRLARLYTSLDNPLAPAESG